MEWNKPYASGAAAALNRFKYGALNDHMIPVNADRHVSLRHASTILESPLISLIIDAISSASHLQYDLTGYQYCDSERRSR